MKRLIATFIFFAVGITFLILFKNQGVDRDTYITQNILDMSRPLNATIDIEFLKELKPAYEQ